MIRINCDMGEGIGNDHNLMPYIHSCSIACGGHYGDEISMKETIRLAKLFNVEVGAHPSFEDKESFGRVYKDIKEEDLVQSILSQVRVIAKIAEKENHPITHLKAHGALYNAAAMYEKEAKVILRVAQILNMNISIYVPPKSIIEKIMLKSNQLIVREVFGDRAYNSDYSLVSRSQPQSVHTDPQIIVDQVKSIWNKGIVATIDEDELPIRAETICLHGDGEGTRGALQELFRK